MLRTKDQNCKEIFLNLHESALQYVVENYKKEVYLEPLIKKLEDVYLSSKEPAATTGTGNKGPIEIAKKIYELELKNTWIGQISWNII